MYLSDLFDTLELDDELVFDEQVEPRLADRAPSIQHGKDHLPPERDSPVL